MERYLLSPAYAATELGTRYIAVRGQCSCQKQVNRLAISPDKMFLAAAGNASVRYAASNLPYEGEHR